MNAARSSAGPPVAVARRLAAAAWRLAGVHVVAIADDAPAREVIAGVDAASEPATAVLLDSACAVRAPAAELAARRRSDAPLVALVDTVAASPPALASAADAVPDVVAHARRVLGVAP